MGDAQRGSLGSLAKLGEGVRVNSDAKTQAGLSRGATQSKKLNAAAWTQTFPAQGTTLDLDFANDRGYVRGVGQGRSMDAVTFTRASNGTYVKPDGTLGQHSNQGALGNNLLTFPQDFDNAAWVIQNGAIKTGTNAVIAPDNTLTADSITLTTALYSGVYQSFTSSATTYTASVYVKVLDGTATFKILRYNATDGFQKSVDFIATTEWQRFTFTFTSTVSAASSFYPIITDSTSGGVFYIWGAQLEVGSSATEYYPTNINQPRFDWASTTSTGAGTTASPYIIPLQANPTSNGLLIEESRANSLLWCRDATNAAWVKTNVTAAKTQTGIDGVANACTSLTATSANGTCVQTVTLASASRTSSVYLKRLSGTGNVQVTMDNVTWTTVDLSNGLWNRIVLSATVTNPVVGIRLATSGDAVAMDFGQIEAGAFVTSPILTTTAIVTRSADVASMSGQNFITWYAQEIGTIYTESFSSTIPSTSLAGIYDIRGAGNNSIMCRYTTTSATFVVTRSSVGDVAAISSIAGRNQFNKVSNTYQLYYGATSANNLFPSVGQISQIFPMNSLFIGQQNAVSISYLNGYIKRFIYMPKKINENAIQVLSGGAT